MDKPKRTLPSITEVWEMQDIPDAPPIRLETVGPDLGLAPLPSEVLEAITEFGTPTKQTLTKEQVDSLLPDSPELYPTPSYGNYE